MSVNSFLSISLFVALFLCLHSYVFYPIIIMIVASLQKTNPSVGAAPTASVLISAFNEEKVIRSRIENLAALDYDAAKLEVIIGSDNSTDRTNEILLELAKKYSWLKVFLFAERRGKASVLNDLIKSARNEILVFTDANTEFQPLAMRNLLLGFGDNIVGGICGRLILKETDENKAKSVEERKYWNYETFIKRSEGRCGILIGANGGIFAVRRDLFNEFPAVAITDDFYITLSVLEQGRKFTYESSAIATEEIAANITSEFRRKVRFAATNFQTLLYFRGLMFNRNLLLSFAFWSHKIIRWFYPFILVAILILSIVLRNTSEIFSLLLYAQVAMYAAGLLGYLLSQLRIRITFFSVIYFFLVSNAALLVGFIRFAQGKHSTIWQSTPR